MIWTLQVIRLVLPQYVFFSGLSHMFPLFCFCLCIAPVTLSMITHCLTRFDCVYQCLDLCLGLCLA